MNNYVKIYNKRGGTTNKGFDYEILNLANIILGVFEKKTCCYLSTNDATAGVFDDICLETPNLITCVQLKHSEQNSKPLYPQNLEACQPNADFGLYKYYNSYFENKIQANKLILSTNRTFRLEGNSLILNLPEFQVKIFRIQPNSEDLISTTNLEDSYGFELIEESVTDKSKVLNYKDFCSKFFLYTNQANCQRLKKIVCEKFERLLGLSREFDSFLSWIADWWKQKGNNVDKLDLDCIQNYLQILVFSSSLNVINFASTNLNQQQKLFKEVISEFEISVFNKTSFAELQTLWAGTRLENETKFHQLISKYQLCKSGYDITQLDDKTKNILLWLLDECPLIVEFNSQLVDVLQYLSKKNLIFLLEENESFSTNLPHVRNLFQIKTKNLEAYIKLVKELSFSVQNNVLSLNDFIGKDDKLMRNFTTDIILSMCGYNPRIGGVIENISFYQNRKITTNIVDVEKYLKKKFGKTLFIIDLVSNLTFLKNLFPGLQFFKFESTNTRIIDTNESIVIYSDGLIDSEDLDKFVTKNSKFQEIHKFRMKGNQFEWIWSKSVQDLTGFISTEFELESKFWDCKPEHKLNLLVDDSGMGKTEFLRNLCNHSLKGVWPVFIQPKDMDVLLKSDEVNLEKFLLNYKYRNLPKVEHEILLICLSLKRVVYLWDGLDEISSKNFQKITDLIVELSNDNNIQWVSSRSHLKIELEKKFNVLSRYFKDFDITEQDRYIKSRLENFENLQDTIDKIRSNFWFIEHKNILGIPLLIYMITELLRLNPDYLQKFQSSFSLVQLYEYFIEEKFKICQNKLRLKSTNNEGIFKILQKYLVDCHQSKSLVAILSSNILEVINITVETDTEDIEALIITAGLITEVIDGFPRFIHQSFAEYFAAKYFVENYNNQTHIEALKKFIFASENRNFRFFFDLLMNDGSHPHIAVLYQNIDLLEAYKDDIANARDKGGRSPLHLLSSWGQLHPKLQVTKKQDYYEIHHDGIFHYECNSNLEDELFRMTPLQYARNCNCLVLEMKLVLQSIADIEKLDDCNLINMLYYSSAFSYNDSIDIFFKKFINKNIASLSIINCKNNSNMNLVYIASLSNNYKMVEFLIQNGSKVDIIDDKGFTPLFISAYNNYVMVVKMLLTAGVNPNVATQEGFTSLHGSASNGYLAVVKLLIEAGAEINCLCNEKSTPLYLAAQNAHFNVVEYLIQSRAEVNIPNKNGFTPLLVASFFGHSLIVEYLLKSSNAEINVCDKDGFTPLCVAAQNNHLTVVKSLIESKADVNLANCNGMAPLYIAARKGHLAIVEYLLQFNPQIDNFDNTGCTPLSAAAQNGHLSVVEVLVKAGADINLGNQNKSSPLYMAAQNGYLSVVKYLVDSGAEIDLVGVNNETPVFVAAECGYGDIVDFLIQSKANFELPDQRGFTPLHVAVKENHFIVVELLLKAGAQSRVSNDGFTPLRLAKINGHLDIIRILLKFHLNFYKGFDFNELVDIARLQGFVHIVDYFQDLLKVL